MKIILTIGLICTVINGCDLFRNGRFSGDIIADERKIENISKVRIGYGFDVKMTIGDNESLIIHAPQDAQQYIYSEIEDDKLVIKLDDDVQPSQLDVKKIYLQVKRIDRIRISGTTTLSCDDLIDTDTMSIVTSGKSKAKLYVNAKETQVESSGASKIIIRGETETLNIDGFSGRSHFDGFNFAVNETFVFASGESKVMTNTAKKLEVVASGSSRIFYKGHPVIQSNLSGDARVENYN